MSDTFSSVEFCAHSSEDGSKRLYVEYYDGKYYWSIRIANGVEYDFEEIPEYLFNSLLKFQMGANPFNLRKTKEFIKKDRNER